MRNFTKLAAYEQAPRFLRFLRMVSVADGAPLPRNQCMVLQASYGEMQRRSREIWGRYLAMHGPAGKIWRDIAEI